MAANKSGLLIFFDEERRRELIRDYVDGTNEPFSDALSVADWGISQLSIALLCFSESRLDYIALAKKGKRVVTSKFKVEFSGMINLDGISIDAIERQLNERLQRYFVRASRGTGGVIPISTWHAVIKAIKAERPRLSGEIDRLLSLQRYSGFRLMGDSADILLQEREALGVSLDFFPAITSSVIEC